MTRRLREAALWAGAVVGLAAVLAGVAVAFFGYSFLVFRSGSMSPDIPTGAVALAHVVEADQIREGDVVSVIADNGERITHRVKTVELDGGVARLVLQGDANATADAEVYEVTSADRVVASVPWGGYVVVHALTPPGLLALAAVSAMLFVAGSSRDRAEDDGDGDGDSDGDGDGGDHEEGGDRAGERETATSGRHAGARRGRLGRRLGLVTAGAIVTVVATGTAGTLAVFTDKPTATTGPLTASRFFTCDAVGRGLAGSPYLYWKLDETALSGTVTGAADSSGNGRGGTYTPVTGVTTGAPKACAGDPGSAVTFDGTTGYVYTTTAAAVTGPDTFTLSLRFRTTTTRGGKLIGFGGSRTGASSNYDRHIYMTNAGRIVFGVYPNAVRTLTSTKAYNDNAWHYVVATLSSAGMKLYLDGELVASRTDTTTAQGYAGWWRIGYDNLDAWDTVPTSRFFAGTLDEVAVFTGAVPSDTDVQEAYVAGF